jgi:ATP-dependent exoDNAse (exonuclease V) beta subunit
MRKRLVTYSSGCNHIYSCCSEPHKAWDTADDGDTDDISVSQNGKESRIDRIVRCDDHILIIDFKTGFPQANIADQYVKQLSAYKKSVENIYGSDIPIKTAILWTKSAQLVECC